MWKAYAPVASGPCSASSGVSPASAPSKSASARLASSEGPPPGGASKTGTTRSARPREGPSDSTCTSTPSSRSSTRDARDSSACAGTPSRASAISIARRPAGATPARRQATPAVHPAGALPARRGPSASTSPRAMIPVLPASMASTAARSGANRRIQSHAGPLAFARRPDASSTESTMSADAGTSTAARRSGSKLLRELRSGAVRGESERLCFLPRPPRHRPAHVAVAEHQRGEQGRQGRSHRPSRMGSQEAPDGASRRGEEVSVPEQRPDAAAERESEDVRQEEEDHPAAPRHGKDVLLRFSHGGGA